jgi:serine/threonine protein kinase
MLLPLLGALQYLHAKGFAHGGLKPANIMAFGEQLKISSDGLVPGGDSTADCGAIGVLLKEVLGANQNADLPEPFAEIARHCLMPDPAARWNPARIKACLRGEPAPPPAQPRSRARWWALAAAAAVILGLIAFWPSQPNHSNQDAGMPAPKGNAVPDSATSSSRPPAESKPPGAPKEIRPGTAKEETSASPPAGRAKAPAEQRPATLDGITKVLPEIPQAARNTITGRVRVNVRVRVDSAGNVNQASLEPPRASKYLSERVLAAARA